MGIVDKLRQNSTDVSGQLKLQASKFKNKDFSIAAMAVCALIAAADGSIDPSEHSKTAALIGSNDILSIGGRPAAGDGSGHPSLCGDRPTPPQGVPGVLDSIARTVGARTGPTEKYQEEHVQ
jgi:hypothetical protein